MARPFMFAALCQRAHLLKHTLAESIFVRRVQKTAKKIFVSRKIRYQGHSLAEVSIRFIKKRNFCSWHVQNTFVGVQLHSVYLPVAAARGVLGQAVRPTAVRPQGMRKAKRLAVGTEPRTQTWAATDHAHFRQHFVRSVGYLGGESSLLIRVGYSMIHRGGFLGKFFCDGISVRTQAATG